MTPLVVALLLFTITQLATVGAAVLMSRSEIKAIRSEFANARASDKETTQLKLDALDERLERIEKQLDDIARLIGGGRRSDDHVT